MQYDHLEDSFCVRNLTTSGAVVVTAMRRAPSGAAATLSCFLDTLGEARGRPCFVVFLQIVHCLALYGRRRMRVGTENWPVLTHDERAFLNCLEACVRDDTEAGEAHGAWLVHPRGASEFAGYVRTMASFLDDAMFFNSGAAKSRPANGRSPDRRPPPATPDVTPRRPASVAENP